ncbi:Uncharacterised protein [Vibrio cholerae]|nr:Uncharacterised protein [Vibrio cholerae]
MKSTTVPGRRSVTVSVTFWRPLIFLPSIFSKISCSRKPARAAGPFGSTPKIMIPPTCSFPSKRDVIELIS